MSKEVTIIVLGVWVVIVPYLGVPYLVEDGDTRSLGVNYRRSGIFPQKRRTFALKRTPWRS